MADAKTTKQHDLNKLLEAAAVVSVAAEGGDSDSSTAMKEATAVKERFVKLASATRLEKVNFALEKVEQFELAFVGLAEQLAALTKEMHSRKRPISGIIDESESQLQSVKVMKKLFKFQSIISQACVVLRLSFTHWQENQFMVQCCHLNNCHKLPV